MNDTNFSMPTEGERASYLPTSNNTSVMNPFREFFSGTFAPEISITGFNDWNIGKHGDTEIIDIEELSDE